MHRATLCLLLAALSAVGAASAEVRPYSLQIRDGEDAAFEVEFVSPHAGRIVLHAEWSGPRIVSFKLEGPGDPPVRERRSGPSPQRLEVDAAAGSATPWKLSIRALPGRGEARGTIRLELPDPPEVVEERKKAAEPPPPPPPAPDPWTVKTAAPKNASDPVVKLFDAVEGLRTRVIRPDGSAAFDACGWQMELLQRSTAMRDALAAGQPPLDLPARRYLARLAATVRAVEAMRTSQDPLVAGPVPEEPLRRRAWLQLHEDRIRPLEGELDSLQMSIRKRYAPSLESEAWISRFLGCLTACQRHFDQRVRQGEDEASGRELAAAQWDTLLSAASVIEALVAGSGGSEAPVGSP